MTESAAQNYEFGSFVLRMDDGVLLKKGEIVPLTPKAIQTLILLVRHHGRLVEKDEIMRKVWANTFVEESSIIRNISVLRKILEEDDAEKLYIETFHRRGYRFVAELRKSVIDPQPVRAVREIAVLPFTLLNPKPETEHLGVGIADTLITHLSNYAQIAARPTTAVLKYAGASDPLAAGRELGVENVLSGNIQMMGEFLRVNLQLGSTKENRSIWGANLNTKITDLLEIQDEISRQVIEVLLPQLTESKQRSVAAAHTPDTQAYQSYLRGRFHWNKRTPENLEKAVSYLHQAIEKDKYYALAYAALADCYLLATGYDVATDFTLEARRRKFDKARRTANIALELDPSLGEAVATLAHVHFAFDWNFEEAERLYRQAIALKPNYPAARIFYSNYLKAFGRIEEGLEQIRKAHALDPLSLLINRNLGATLISAEKYDEAAAQYEAMLEIEPNYIPAFSSLAFLHNFAGRHSEALRLLEKAAQIAPDNQLVLTGVAEVHAAAGRREETLEIIQRLQTGEFAARISSVDYALIYNYLGDTDKVFEYLECAYNERDTGVLLLRAYPELKNLRSDWRFFILLRHIGLEK